MSRDNKLQGYERIIYTGIIVIALGVVFSTTLEEESGSLGTVFIAIGGLLFIAGMARKRKEDRETKE